MSVFVFVFGVGCEFGCELLVLGWRAVREDEGCEGPAEVDGPVKDDVTAASDHSSASASRIVLTFLCSTN